jgi:hypothetical protein
MTLMLDMSTYPFPSHAVLISLRRKLEGASTRFDVVLKRKGTGADNAEAMDISPRKGNMDFSGMHRMARDTDVQWRAEELEEREREVEKSERNLERSRQQVLEELQERERELRHQIEMAKRGPQTRSKAAQTDESIAQRAWQDAQDKRCVYGKSDSNGD